MSCDNSTTCTAIVDLVSLPNLEPRDFGTADATHVAGDQPLKRCRSGPTGDRSQAKAHIIPDSTQIVPEYVWGDEGPVND
jgi:hypothetical protein